MIEMLECLTNFFFKTEIEEIYIQLNKYIYNRF